MKKLLVVFFQVLFMLQFFGHGQLHAHPRHEFKPLVRGAHPNAALGSLNGNSAAVISHLTGPQTFIRLAINDLDENEYESISSKKSQGNSHVIVSSFYARSIGYFFQDSKSSLAFCKQITPRISCKRHIIFEVIRI